MRPEDLGIGKLFERVRDAVIVADAASQQRVLWNPAAIQEANDTPGTDTIDFGLFGTGVRTSSPLPSITEHVTINGYSQSGSSVNTLASGTNAKPVIELDGTYAGHSADGLRSRRRTAW